MNIHGYCPHCNANLDGDLVINYPLSQGKSMDEAFKYAYSYEGWDEYKILNRWNRTIGLYSQLGDCTIGYRCPDCNGVWGRNEI